MTEIKHALSGAAHIIILLVLATLVDPVTKIVFGELGWLGTEAVSLIVVAFAYDFTKSIFWERPRLTVQWDAQSEDQTPGYLKMRLDNRTNESGLIFIRIHATATKALSRFILRQVSYGRSRLQIQPIHAPLAFIVNSSARDKSELPLAIPEPGTAGLEFNLHGEPPNNGGLWLYARGNYVASDVIIGSGWEVQYVLRADNFIKRLFARLVHVEPEIVNLEITER